MAKIYRKSGFYEQSKALFQKLIKQFDNILNKNKGILSLHEQKIKMELSYNKCLFEKGELNEAIKKSKNLVDLLHINNSKDNNNIYHKIDNKLKGKIYGNYAVYIKQKFINSNTSINNIQKHSSFKQKKEFFISKLNESYSPQLMHRKSFVLNINNSEFTQLISKEINYSNKSRESLLSYNKNKIQDISFNKLFDSKIFKNKLKEVNNINHYLILATKYYNKYYKYWSNFSSFNYSCYKYLHNRRIKVKETMVEDYDKKIEISLKLEISFAKNSINGIKKCLEIIGNNLDKSYQNCIRLIDIFFNIGGDDNELRILIASVFYEYDLKIFVQILPLLISRLGNKNLKILET